MTQDHERKARQWALDNDYTFEWSPHEEHWEDLTKGSEVDPEDLGAIDELLMYDADGEVVQSLSVIMFGTDEDRADRERLDFEERLAAEEQRSSTATTSGGVSQDDVDVINRHRRDLGMGPVDPAMGWSDEELRAQAESIRTTGRMNNPAHEALKRKLMR